MPGLCFSSPRDFSYSLCCQHHCRCCSGVWVVALQVKRIRLDGGYYRHMEWSCPCTSSPPPASFSLCRFCLPFVLASPLRWPQVKRLPLPCRTHGGTSGSSVSLLMLLAMRVLWYQASSSSSTSREGTTWRQVGAGVSLPRPASLGALCPASVYPAQVVSPACIVRLEPLTRAVSQCCPAAIPKQISLRPLC